jgi:hypothetical protein
LKSAAREGVRVRIPASAAAVHARVEAPTAVREWSSGGTWLGENRGRPDDRVHYRRPRACRKEPERRSWCERAPLVRRSAATSWTLGPPEEASDAALATLAAIESGLRGTVVERRGREFRKPFSSR